MERLQKRKRYFAVDISCVIGIILMLGLHFFEKSGFEQQPLTGLVSLLPLALRWLCMAGVPIIVMANGAALSRDTFSFSQYKGLYKLIYTAVICFVAVWFYSSGNPDSFPESSIKPFYYFDGCDYALMYAVLLLLSPFLNCAYQALPNMKSKTVLVGVMTFLTTMPNILIFGGNFLLPVELTQLWPVTYYFIGAYIWENRKKFDLPSYLVLMISLCFSQAILSYADSLSSDMQNFDSKRLNQYSSVNVAATAAVVFMIMCRLKTKSKPVRHSVKALARLSLPILLISWIFEDNILRLIIGSNQYGDLELMKYFLPFLLAAAVASYISSAVITAPFSVIYSLLRRIGTRADEAQEAYSDAEDCAAEDDGYDVTDEPEKAEEYTYVGRYERTENPSVNAAEEKEEPAIKAPESAAESSFKRSSDEMSVDELLAMITANTSG